MIFGDENGGEIGILSINNLLLRASPPYIFNPGFYQLSLT